jgi:hypothetical protein
MQILKKNILIFGGILFCLPIFAQNLNLSFRLYDKNEELISPFRFETEVECYSQMQQQNALVLQKRLKFDERSYYYLYQTEWIEGQAEQVFFVLGEDTLSLQLEHLKTNNIVIDQLIIKQGEIVLAAEQFRALETISKPEEKRYTFWADRIEPKTIKKWINLPKRLRRLRFSNFMQILHSRG